MKGERWGGAGTPDPRGPRGAGRGKPAWRARRKAVAVAFGWAAEGEVAHRASGR